MLPPTTNYILQFIKQFIYRDCVLSDSVEKEENEKKRIKITEATDLQMSTGLSRFYGGEQVNKGIWIEMKLIDGNAVILQVNVKDFCYQKNGIAMKIILCFATFIVQRQLMLSSWLARG